MKFAPRTAAAALGSGLILAACGPTPPQAPLPYAKKLDSATSGISTACGLASQVTAFPGNHRNDLITLEVTAGASGLKLASVYRHNPAWIYQGETVRQIVTDSVSLLGSCGLRGAQTELKRLTGRR
jgi:hypothetical protein